MYLVYKCDYIQQLFHEPKKLLFAYKCDRKEHVSSCSVFFHQSKQNLNVAPVKIYLAVFFFSKEKLFGCCRPRFTPTELFFFSKTGEWDQPEFIWLLLTTIPNQEILYFLFYFLNQMFNQFNFISSLFSLI